MGYKPSKKLYEITFQDHPDLEITAIGASLGRLLDIGEININLKDQTKIREVFEFFSTRLVTWNIEHPDLEDESEEVCSLCGMAPGMPLPTTAQAMFCLDMTFVMQIFFGWMEAVARLPIPKGLNTQHGMNQQEDLMKMLGELQSPLASPMLR